MRSRSATRLLLAPACILAACGDDLSPEGNPPAGAVTVMSYNLAQIDGGGGGATAVADEIAAAQPDLVAVQECVDCDSWLPGELGDYAVIEPRAGVAIAYDSSRWGVSDSGVLALGDNDDGWGERVAQWALLSTGDGLEGIYLYATHWCVTIRRLDDRCTVERQMEYAAALVAHVGGRAAPQLPVVVAGDFNVFDGFEDGDVISFLVDAGMVDLFRIANPTDDGTTFLGNSWAPSGRLDYVFSTEPVDVIESRIDPVAEASDHYPVLATVAYPALQH